MCRHGQCEDDQIAERGHRVDNEERGERVSRGRGEGKVVSFRTGQGLV